MTTRQSAQKAAATRALQNHFRERYEKERSTVTKVTLLGPIPAGGSVTCELDDPVVDRLKGEGWTVSRTWEVPVPTPRTWGPRPDRRRGWVSDDGYEIEWCRAEGSEPAGYYLFGNGIFGRRLDRMYKQALQSEANFIIDMRKAGHDA